MSRYNLDKNMNQRESPKLILRKRRFLVKGYQTFEIDSQNIYNPQRKLLKKSKIIRKIIRKYQRKCQTLLDIGCSQGYYSYYAYFKKYQVTSIEHDPMYVKQLDTINRSFNLNINVKRKKFSMIKDSKYDIVLFLALIHWVYNSTDNFNSFKKILKKLYQLTGRILIIEWITEKDSAITSTDKVKYKDYNTTNFISELHKLNFEKIIKKKSNSDTRFLFICHK